MVQENFVATIIGGSGFVGRYVAQRLAQRGWRVRVACRRPNEAMFVKTYGVVGQVMPVQCNIRDEDSCRRVIAGSDAVVNCVGVLWEDGKNTFDSTQNKGSARIARLCREEGVDHLVHISAIGADPDSESAYAKTKAAGERAVMDERPDAVILRPSVIFGPEDEFFNMFAAMTRIAPVLPIPGAGTRLQPVWVEDVAEAATRGATGEAAPGIYELGGPRVVTLRECIELMLATTRRRRLIVDLPLPIARANAWFLEKSAWFGIKPMLTRDQLTMLLRNNVVDPEAKGFKELGIEPTAMESVLDTYLYAYRPQGQYTDLADDEIRA